MSDKAQETSPIGRPSKYKAEYVELAYKFCLLGATNEKLAELFDVAVSTVSLWLVEHEAFSEAVKRGRSQADAEIAHALYHRALGYSHKAVKIFADVKSGDEKIVEYTEHYPPDTAAAFIWLKNRAGWRDKHETELTGKDGGPIETADVTDSELARRIAFTLANGLKPQETTH
jgi:hypothetical protein